ncbi:arylamine N-acetyltransferase [Azospirillum fermentarium]|uniref:hypothetical protein n=1 Tax=Azospirillum fermentarium TaxID=1233114 RepID=UPI002226C9B0|nr:hypothetical protein [Azospirillum fermentarium]MCW2247740.1 arylamine N-acetyltransferase [Azospirillum fermentarium]
MLLSELVYPRPFLLHRIANREALYYEHTHDRRPESTLAYIIVQVGYGLGGSGEILARALLLALAQHAAGCGYHVRYSFAGRTLTGPEPLDRPSDVLRALQYRDPAIADGAGTLSAVLEHLQGWRRTYRRREVLWIVSECFDADHADEHAELYHALEREASQTAWIVSSGRTASPLPAHRMFPVRHYLGTGILHRLVPGMPPVPAYATRQTEMDHDPV